MHTMSVLCFALAGAIAIGVIIITVLNNADKIKRALLRKPRPIELDNCTIYDFKNRRRH